MSKRKINLTSDTQQVLVKMGGEYKESEIA